METKNITSKTKTHYSYRRVGNHYVLYEDDKVHRQPHGRIVSTKQEGLAAKLVKALEKGEKYTVAQSLLCYHYTYCNYRRTSLKIIREQLVGEMKYEHFLYDDYLMFGQNSAVRQSIAVYMSENYEWEIKSFNRYQLVAVQVVAYCYSSWMLPMHIVDHVIHEMKNRPYHTVKHEFLQSVEDFFLLTCDDEDDAKTFTAYRRRLSKTIDTFVYYFSLK